MATMPQFSPGPIPKPSINYSARDTALDRAALSLELIKDYNDAATSIDPSASVPAISGTASKLTLNAPDIGERPFPQDVGAYLSVIEDVALADITALRSQLGLIDAEVEDVQLPVFGLEAPVFTAPALPDDTLPSISADAPSLTEANIPVAPDFELPAVPTLAEIAIPSAPDLTNLSFDAVMPTADLTPPEPMFIYNEGTYASDVADAIRTKLFNDVTYGGTGLNAETEQAIWDRASDRLEYELSRNYAAELNNFEAWGFEIPDGVLSANLREVLAEGTRRRSELNRDILIKQSELAQQNTQFAITSGLVHEKQLMDFTNQIANRAFEVAKFVFEAPLAAFRVKVDAFNAHLEGYKVQAQVFEARIRAEIARTEIYRTQMEGAKLRGELNMQAVELYSRRLQGVQLIADLFKTRMESARIVAEIDRVRLEGFRATIDAKRAQIEGVTAKYNLYQAQLSGEKTKADIYNTQVDAFSKQVDAKKVEADINLAQLQAQLESNRDRVAVLQAAVDKYKADASYQTDKEESNVRAYGARVEAYSADVSREQGHVTALVERYRAQVTETAARLEVLVKESDSNIRAAVAAAEINMEAMKASANISAQKIASALSAVSTSTQIGYNESVSQSFTGSQSYSAARSEAMVHSKNYTD